MYIYLRLVKKNGSTRYYPLQNLPYSSVEADRDAVERAVETAPPHPLAVTIVIHRHDVTVIETEIAQSLHCL